jgi:outer membrane murein-binding lipoprotein Lpp
MQIDGEAMALVAVVVGALSSAVGLLYTEKNKLNTKVETAIAGEKEAVQKRLEAEVGRREAAESRAANADKQIDAIKEISDRQEATIKVLTEQQQRRQAR